MKDIFKKYKKANVVRNFGIITASLLIAFSINFFILDSDMGNKLKTDVLGVNNNTSKSNLYLEVNSGKINLKTNKNIQNLKNISLTFVYNPENVELNEINSSLSKTTITEISNEPGLNTIIINLDTSINIEKQTEILSLNVSKKQEKTEGLNIINANFEDNSGKTYLLSTSGTKF